MDLGGLACPASRCAAPNVSGSATLTYKRDRTFPIPTKMAHLLLRVPIDFDAFAAALAVS
jgi:hypothetical protein